MKKVLYFGIYDPNYSRNRVIITGFMLNGYEVTECRINPRENKGLSKYWKLLKLGLEFKKKKFDLIVLGFPSQTIVWLAFLIFGKRTIFDAYLSLYDSNVYDRKIHKKWSIGGLKDYVFDWMGPCLSSKTLLDTNQHIDYYSKTFHINRRKFVRVLIGADDQVFDHKKYDLTSHGDQFIVEFHGMFIPLQGVEYIVKAAHILRSQTDIVFNIVGHGQTFKECKRIADEAKLNNINFVGKVSVDRVPPYIAGANVCLGIFGNTQKTKRVIPNKVYECMAMRKPVITADSPAAREILRDKIDVVFSNVADPQDLANKILLLRNQPDLGKTIAEEGYKTYLAKCSPRVIVAQLLRDIYEK